MHERLNPRDLAFLANESASTPMHNATIEIFDPGDSGFDHATLVELIRDRIAFVPRYRQRVAGVPGRLANPVWVDDDEFDLTYHVRRSALPRPGSMEQLRELVGRVVSRPLDRSRPLWEVYFVEGLADGQVAILSKSHQVLVDGVATVDLGQVLLDVDPEPRVLEHDDWRPRARPSPVTLAASAVSESLRDPRTAVNTVRSNTEAVLRTAGSVRHAVGGAMGALAPRASAVESPVGAARLSEHRLFMDVRTDLSVYRAIREAHGGTVNDVILATITGGLRAWLMTRNQSLRGRRSLRAVVPMSVIDDDLEATSLGTQIAGHLVNLPIGEPSPTVRLHQVTYAFKAHSDTGHAVGAARLAGIAGFAPTTFHALGSRVAAREQRRGFDLAVTNVPGPQFPLYAAGARMLASYPMPPLLPGHALGIGVTSYDGHVHYGITADRLEVPDVEVLGQCLDDALDELRETAGPARRRAPRGRRTKKTGSRTEETSR